MNITISIDDDLAERARELASRQGTSVNGLLRRYLETLVGTRPGTDVAAELLELMREHPGHSGGRKVRREDAYEERG